MIAGFRNLPRRALSILWQSSCWRAAIARRRRRWSRPRRGVRGHDPDDWVNDPPAVRPVDFSAVTFGNPALRNTLLDACRRLVPSHLVNPGQYPVVVDDAAMKSGAPSKSGEVHLIRIGHVPSSPNSSERRLDAFR